MTEPKTKNVRSFDKIGYPPASKLIVNHVIKLVRLTGQKKQEEVVKLYEKRVEDVSESKEDYEELAHKLDQSIDLLIKVFKRNGG